METLLGRVQSLTAARQIRPLGREIVRRGDEGLPALVELIFGQCDLGSFLLQILHCCGDALFRG